MVFVRRYTFHINIMQCPIVDINCITNPFVQMKISLYNIIKPVDYQEITFCNFKQSSSVFTSYNIITEQHHIVDTATYATMLSLLHTLGRGGCEQQNANPLYTHYRAFDIHRIPYESILYIYTIQSSYKLNICTIYSYLSTIRMYICM